MILLIITFLVHSSPCMARPPAASHAPAPAPAPDSAPAITEGGEVPGRGEAGAGAASVPGQEILVRLRHQRALLEPLQSTVTWSSSFLCWCSGLDKLEVKRQSAVNTQCLVVL